MARVGAEKPLKMRPRLARASWSVAAQGLASASNFGVQFGLVLTMTAHQFGSLVVGFAIFHLASALGRAWVGDPLLAMAETPGDVVGLWLVLRRRLVAIGMASMPVVLLWSAVASEVRVELAILALAMPALLLQDGHRYRAWALGRFPRVVGLDGCWLAISMLVVGSVVTFHGRAAVDGRVVMLAWVAGGFGAWQLARLFASGDPKPDGAGVAEPIATPTPSYNSEAGQAAARRLSFQQAILAVDANGLPVALTTAASATVAAGVRTVVLPFAPMTSVLSGIRVLVLPALRDAAHSGHARSTIVKVSTLYSAVALVMAAASMAVLAAIPNSWLGETGELVRGWFPLGAVVVACRMIALPFADLLSLRPGSIRVGLVRTTTSAIDWSATLIGAVVFGLEGAIVGRALAGVSSVVIWGSLAAISLRRSPFAIDEPNAADSHRGKGGGEGGEGRLEAPVVMGGWRQQ